MNNVKCWNCHNEFEVVSSAENSVQSSLSPSIIAELLRSNMFDAQRGGTVIMNVDDMIEEVSEIIAEYLEK